MAPDLAGLLVDLGLQHHVRRLGRRYATLAALGGASERELREAGVAEAEDRRRIVQELSAPPPAYREQACFEFASYYATFANLSTGGAEEGEDAKAARFPQYILVGDQSAGKTSVLSRLAKMQLGFVASKTGTRRPFEFTLLFEVGTETPRVEVDGRDVPLQDLFAVLKKKNEVDGFCSVAVSVKIRSCHLKNLSITDMPGMKDGDDRPTDMLLERLANPEVTPIVVLEPRDMQQKHAVYDLLEKANPPRKRADIIVLQNKCDTLVQCEKKSNWRDSNVWRDHYATAQEGGFKRVFFTGMPPKVSDNETEEEQLRCSWRREDTMFREWGQEVGHTDEQRGCMGIRTFAAHLAGEQMMRAEAFAIEVGPDVGEALDMVRNLRQRLESEEKHLQSNIMSLLCQLSAWMKQAFRGEIDSACVNGYAQNLEQDLGWLVDNFEFRDNLSKSIKYPESVDLVRMFADDQEGSPDGHPAASEHGSEGAPPGFVRERILQHMMPTKGDDWKLFGGAAIERASKLLAESSMVFALVGLRWELTPNWVQNVLGEGEVKDSGNKVVREFLRKLMRKKIHPLIDVVFCLICQHMDRIASAVLEEPYEGHPWSQQYKEVVPFLRGRFEKEFRKSCTQFFRKAVGEERDLLHSHIEKTTDRMATNIISYTNIGLAQHVIRNTTGLEVENEDRKRRARPLADWDQQDEWQKDHMKHLASAMIKDIDPSSTFMIQRCTDSIDMVSESVEEVLSKHNVEGVGLNFPMLWKNVAEVVHVQIKSLGDDFRNYVESAKDRVSKNLEKELQEHVALKADASFRKAWKEHHKEELERITQMEMALQKSREVYDRIGSA